MASIKSASRSSTTVHQAPPDSTTPQHQLREVAAISHSAGITTIWKRDKLPPPEAVLASDGRNTSSHEEPSTGSETLEDGGLIGWTQVFLSHLINFNSFGYMLSFGIFQSYYTEVLHFSPSNVSWIGTMELFLVYFVGVLSGRLMDAGYYRYTLFTGLLLQVVGCFATSFCTKYWQLFLAQGLCQGLGHGLLFCPAVALVSTYFSADKKAFAVSIVASGGATGGMVFPAVAEYLLERIGFAWTVRVMGFIMLFVAAAVMPFSKPRLQGFKKKAWLDLTAFREPPYVLFCIGIFLAFWGLYFAYYYVTPFGRNILHLSQRTSFSMILIINSFGIPGRAIPALFADRYSSPLGVIIPVICVTGLLLYCWIAIKSAIGFSIWVAVYGFFAGGCQSLFQAASSSFTSDLEKVGVRIGMIFTIVSFACLSGSPLSGGLVEHLQGRYLAAQLFGGTVMVAGSIALLAAWVLKGRIEKRAASSETDQSPSRN